MSKPILQPCSEQDCRSAASIIIAGKLLCADHAVEAYDRSRSSTRRATASDDSGSASKNAANDRG